MSALLDYFINVAVGVIGLLLLFEGSRRILQRGRRKNAGLMLVGGLVMSLGTAGIAFMQYRMSHDAIQTTKRPIISKHLPLPNDWGAACCKDTREEQSRKLVQAAFVETGRLHEYIDSSGKRTPYSPTEKDVKEREERVLTDARFEDASRAQLSQALYALIAAVLSTLFGLALGYEERKTSANSTAEPDARKSGARGSP